MERTNARVLRERQGKEQWEVAQALSIPQSSLGRFEAGTSRMRWDRLIRIAQYYGVSLEELTGEAPLPPSPDTVPA